SVRVALVVGSLLNIINQPKLILVICLIDLNALHDVNYLKAVLTYLVPFFVSLYGALSMPSA
ncbi:nitrate/nitrite transporter NrtS, partial [Methyloglobulus morosus]|uniref:nitrate/nitrite transporter NrtS n=1 Tax=Methyloglobulus morosus TaxID=1410681 RepID=UPI001910AFD3